MYWINSLSLIILLESQLIYIFCLFTFRVTEDWSKAVKHLLHIYVIAQTHNYIQGNSSTLWEMHVFTFVLRVKLRI